MDGSTYRYFHGYPMFPFGYGMSYTEFNYTQLTVSPTTIKPCDNVTVSVTVQNIGKLAGDEVSLNQATYAIRRRRLVYISSDNLPCY